MHFSATLDFEPRIFFNEILVYMVLKWNLTKKYYMDSTDNKIY